MLRLLTPIRDGDYVLIIALMKIGASAGAGESTCWGQLLDVGQIEVPVVGGGDLRVDVAEGADVGIRFVLVEARGWSVFRRGHLIVMREGREGGTRAYYRTSLLFHLVERMYVRACSGLGGGLVRQTDQPPRFSCLGCLKS